MIVPMTHQCTAAVGRNPIAPNACLATSFRRNRDCAYALLNPRHYLRNAIANGRIGDAVAPRIFSGEAMNRNSYT
jgi:hypothetical protein